MALKQLMMKYDPLLNLHCLKLQEFARGSKRRVPSNLSKAIQNEFKFCLDGHVKQKNIADIKKG